MTKSFDEICRGILGEMITAPAQQQQQQKPAQPQQQAAPAPQTGAVAAVQQNQQQKQTPQQQAPQMKDEELLKILAQKIQDPKFLPQLQALMNPQQPNAANQPVQKA